MLSNRRSRIEEDAGAGMAAHPDPASKVRGKARVAPEAGTTIAPVARPWRDDTCRDMGRLGYIETRRDGLAASFTRSGRSGKSRGQQDRTIYFEEHMNELILRQIGGECAIGRK